MQNRKIEWLIQINPIYNPTKNIKSNSTDVETTTTILSVDQKRFKFEIWEISLVAQREYEGI